MLGSVLSEERKRSFDRWWEFLRSRDSLYWVAVGLVVLYVYLIILPFTAILIGSFTARGTSIRGPVQIDGWIETYYTVRPVLMDTLIYALGLAIVTTVLACGIAWSIARTNVPYGRAFYYLTFVGFFFPPVAWEIVWIRLLGRNGLYAVALGLETLHVASIPGMILVSSIRWIPLGLILLIPLFASMDKTLEEAGQSAGASTLRVARDITIPILRPGIFAVFLLLFIIGLGDFRVPLLIGAPQGIRVLSVTIYQNISTAPPSWGIAMTQSVILVLIALPCLYLYKRSLGSTQKFATISGRGYQRNPVEVGRFRYVIFAALSLFFFFAMGIPTLLLIYTSLLPFYIPPHQFADFGMFTIQAYIDVTTNTRLLQSIGNSFIVAFIATSLLIVGAVVNAWIVQKTTIPFREKLDYLSFSVIGIPPVPLAMGLVFVYLVYIPGGAFLYNTLFILIIAMYTRFIAGMVRILEPSVIQIKGELLEAGRMAGDSITSRLRYIVLPLIKDNAQAAWAMRFSVIFLELPIVAVLATRETEMVAMALLILQDQGNFPQVAAFGVVCMVLLGAVTLLVHRI